MTSRICSSQWFRILVFGCCGNPNKIVPKWHYHFACFTCIQPVCLRGFPGELTYVLFLISISPHK